MKPFTLEDYYYILNYATGKLRLCSHYDQLKHWVFIIKHAEKSIKEIDYIKKNAIKS